MNGQKGLTIVVVALLLTICIGFLFNAEQQTVNKTVYEDRADLSALMALNSSREKLTEDYNSNYNVIGWDPVDGIPVTTTPNYYIISPRVVNYHNQSVTINLDSVEHLSGAFRTYVNPDKQTRLTTDNTEFTNGDTYASGKPFNGGIWGIGAGSLSFTRNFTTWDPETMQEHHSQTYPTIQNGERIQWDNILTLMPEPTDGTRVYMSEQRINLQFAFNITANSVFSNNRDYAINTYLEGFSLSAPAQYNTSYYQWNHATEKWDVYIENVLKKQSVDLFVWGVYDGTTETFNLSVPDVVPATYADPTKLVNVPAATASTPAEDLPSWSNTDYNDSLVNASVTLMVKGSTNIYAAGGSIEIVENSGVYSIGSLSLGSYPNGILVTLDAQTKIVTIEGIISANSTAPATDYRTAGFTYQTSWNATSAEITKISFRSATGFNAYIVKTVVYTDPNNLLWVNFNLDINNYFASVISTEAGARVIFNGFVSYGDKLTINGQNFNVADGKITVPYDDGYGERPTQFKLNGMAIDYNRNGTVNLVFTEDKNKTVSLGETANYIITGSGAWYFSSHVMQIKNIEGMEWAWVSGWTLDINQTCAVMLGLLVVGLLIGLYFGRGSLDSYDWIILILAAFATFSIMVV